MTGLFNLDRVQHILVRFMRAFAAAIALLGGASVATAQGTGGFLPGPITTHELKGYADRLQLSEQQRQAAEAIHDQYKRDFRSLRQGEIAAFLKEMRSMQSNVVPNREVMEGFMKKMDMLQGRIATLDSRMFDQLQTILTDEQMAMMPRVRMARQRARFAENQMMWMTGNRAVDLSEVLAKIELAADQRQAIDPILAQYEARLTTSMSKLYEATNGMMMKIIETLEEMGFTEQDMSDPEKAQKFGETMQQIWRDLTMQAIEAAGLITDVNQRTYRTVASNLPADKARELRNSYYRLAFPEAGMALTDETLRFDEALKLDDLTSEQRDALTAARLDVQHKLDRIVEEVVRLVEQNRANFSPFDFGSESAQEYSRQLQDFTTRVTETRKAATDLLAATLGEERARTIEKAAMSKASESGGLGAMMRAAMEKAEAARADATDESDASAYIDDAQAIQEAWTGDQFVAPPISRSDVTRYAEVLDIASEQKPLLTQLHATYLEQFKNVQENEISALTKALQSMWKFDIDTQTSTGPTSESVQATQRARKAAIEAVAKADETFFNDVQVALLDETRSDALQRVRLMRQRDTWNRGTEGMWMFGGRAGEHRIDLAAFMQRQPIPDQHRSALDELLRAYEQAATPLFGQRFQASIDMQGVQDQWQVELAQSRNDGENNQFKIGARYQEMFGQVSKQVAEAGNAISALNRESLAKVIAALPADVGSQVQDAYNRAAFPSVYNDPLSLERVLNEAAKLPDLGPEQQRRLNDIAAEFRPAYAHLCVQMTDIAADAHIPSFAPDDQQNESWKRWQERREALANLRFDRDELCQRTMNQLKAILNEDQIRRLGGMPEPKKREPYEDWID